MFRKTTFIIAAAIAASLAQANDFITFTGVNEGYSGGVQFTLKGVDTPNYFAGKLNFDSQNGSSTGSDHFTSFCTDMEHIISSGDTYEVKSPQYTKNFATGSNLWGAGNILAKTFYAVVGDGNKTAAAQIAIWKATYDGASVDYTTGNLKAKNVDAGILSQAVVYGSYFSAATEGAIYLERIGNNGQHQMTVVPEPASMSALALGVGSILARRRRKR